MTPEEQRIAIAKACGWTCCGQVQGLHPHGLVPWRKIGDYSTQEVLNHEVPIDTLPDYLDNLNAMHAAWLTLPHSKRDRFEQELYAVVIGDADYNRNDDAGWITNAAAAQRAEAFLKTLSLWTE